MWTTVLASAVVAAAVTALFNVVVQWRDRVARRKELVFRTAIEITQKKIEFDYEFAKEQKIEAKFYDVAVMGGIYYQWLYHLFRKGVLPKDALDSPSGAELKIISESWDQFRKQLFRRN